MKSYLPGNTSPRFAETDLSDCVSEFAEEVESGNFIQGEGRCLLIVGEGSRDEAHRWVACLSRAGFDVYRTTAVELVRVLSGKSTLDEERTQDFGKAQTYVILDMFDVDTTGALSPREGAELINFVRTGVDDGLVFVFQTDDDDADPDLLGENFGAFIMDAFEAVKTNGTYSKTNEESERPKKDSDTADGNKHGGSETAVGHSAKRRSKSFTGNRPRSASKRKAD